MHAVYDLIGQLVESLKTWKVFQAEQTQLTVDA